MSVPCGAFSPKKKKKEERKKALLSLSRVVRAAPPLFVAGEDVTSASVCVVSRGALSPRGGVVARWCKQIEIALRGDLVWLIYLFFRTIFQQHHLSIRGPFRGWDFGLIELTVTESQQQFWALGGCAGRRQK